MPRRCRLQNMSAMLRGSITKLALCWFNHGDHSAYASGKQDSMPTEIDRKQWTDVWDHRHEYSWCCDSEVEVR